MKNNWQIKTLGEVCEIVTGNTPKTSNKNFYGDFMMWAGPADLDLDPSVLDTKKKLSEEGVERGGVRVVPSGSVLMSCIGYIGKLGIAIENMATNQQINTFVPNKQLIDSKFLYYQLRTKVNEFENKSSQATLPIINKSKCAEVSVSIPPLAEQKRIVKILDEKFEAIEELKNVTEQQIVDAKELFESRLSELFNNQNWETRSFSDSSVFTIEDGDRGKNYPSKNDFDKQGHCLFMSTKNVRPNGFDFSDPVFITKAKDEELRKGKLQRGDVVMTTRGTIGNIGVYSDEVVFDHIRINSGMVIFRPNLQVIKPEFLFELLRAPIILDQIKKLTSGAAQPQLPIKTIKQFIFKLAPLGEQDNIIQELDELSEKTKGLEAIFRRKIADLEELKKSYLEQAFAGKL